MGDWLTDLALGTASGNKNKGNLPLNIAFNPENHTYETTYIDTEHNVYLWASGSGDIQAQYTQVFADAVYHGVGYYIDMVSGKKTGEKLNRLLMDENPIENTLTVRLTKEENGVTCYQDYLVESHRELTLKDIAAKCDGVTTTLVQEDGTPGYLSNIRNYDVTVSMAAQMLDLTFEKYVQNTCYGEGSVGYEILVDGKDVTSRGGASIPLDGTMNTQVVTIEVRNAKAPEGTGVYTLNILKSPPVEAAFEIAPADALLNIYEIMSGERLWPDENGAFQLCEGYCYVYTTTEYGFVGKSGTLDVTRNDRNELVVRDGDTDYAVTASSTATTQCSSASTLPGNSTSSLRHNKRRRI